MTTPAADPPHHPGPGWGARLRDEIAHLSRSPDLTGARALIWLALGVWLLVSVLLAARAGALTTYGDTDDAMRLVIVRALAAGRGWYDQAIPRLDHGAWLHWSRLLDGGIAGFMIVLRQFMPPATAEYWTRYLWPLLWVLPAVAAALAIARDLGARSAPFLTTILLLTHFQLYRQFIPGRIDHHDIQITMTVVALACALAAKHRTRWALGCGAAASLGLAIGLEALPFQALIGASYGLELMRDRRGAAPAAAYGLTLAAGAAVLFLVQTPPWRWGMPFCDSLAPNLVGALAAAGLGLAVVAWASSRLPAWARMALVAVAGAVAVGVYLALDPQCIHGPFAAMNPAVRPFWFDHIQEVQHLPVMFRLQPTAAMVALAAMIASLVAAVVLVGRQWRSPSTPVLLMGALLPLACAIAWSAWRMQDYVFWIGIPALGAAASHLARRYLRDLMLPSAAVLVALSPVVLGTVAEAMTKATTRPGPRLINSGPRCFDPRVYPPLAAVPHGMVLAPIDLGPFILATTRQSVEVAPYHRLSNQILAAHLVFAGPPAQAEARVRALGASMIVDCPPYPLTVSAGSFGDELRKRPPPPWLQVLSRPGAVLKIYRVKPPAA